MRHDAHPSRNRQIGSRDFTSLTLALAGFSAVSCPPSGCRKLSSRRGERGEPLEEVPERVLGHLVALDFVVSNAGNFDGA